MKKAPILLLAGLCLLTACSRNLKDDQAFQTIASQDPNATVSAYQFTYKETENSKDDATPTTASSCNFIIDRCKLRKPGANISVDDALSLLISEITLSSAPNNAFKFLGYDTLEDGTCYIISYGKLTGNNFTETVRYAVSYNKTIYQARYKNGKLASYKEVYSIETGKTGYKNNITAKIKDGILTIKDKDSKHTISSFTLKKYGLSKATSDDILIMDMNFDGYLDIAIYTSHKDNSFHYHTFLYEKKKKQFIYEISYSYLISPQFSFQNETISCASMSTSEFVYDTYRIVNNQPEISERVSYTYDKTRKAWRMNRYTGENGDLILKDTAYYSSKEVSEITGEFLTDN